MLAALERQFQDDPFVVVGVHSPKFPTERDPEMVREAARRYGVTHPVVVDAGMNVWRDFGVKAWPTLVLVDAEGWIAASGAGEPDAEMLASAVRRLLAAGREKGALAAGPPPGLRPEPAPLGSLSYPGKVAAAGGKIFVADTGHHQVVVCDAQGREETRIGSGVPGAADGRFAECSLNHPNGLAPAGDVLYVAATRSHTIRACDLAAGTVSTVAGTGQKGAGLAVSGGPATAVALRSPWDLSWDGRRLFVAMAGSHQIWVLDPAAGEIRVLAGTGREIRRDGPAAAASFAQPSGIALLDGALYVADSEISSVRVIEDLDGEPRVRTVCGSGELFGFGDRDGFTDAARLQHPMGIAAGEGRLWLADTFNHEIKVIDPGTGECRTAFGAVEAERKAELVPGEAFKPAGPGAPAFWEPEGLAVRGDELLVADTNNHRLLAVSIPTGRRRALLGG